MSAPDIFGSPTFCGLIAVSALFCAASSLGQVVRKSGEVPVFQCKQNGISAAVYSRGEYNPHDKSGKYSITLQDKSGTRPVFMNNDGIAVVAEARKWCDGQPLTILKPTF